MIGQLKRTSDAASEPVTTAEAKAHLGVDLSDDDTLIADFVTAARNQAGDLCSRAWVNETWTLTLDEFPSSLCPIYLWRSPLVSVTSITYLDTNGDSQTWSNSLYRVDTQSEPGRVTPIHGETYPSTYDTTGAVTVTFVCGYGADATNVPEQAKLAIKWLCDHWYRNIRAVDTQPAGPVPQTFEDLLRPLMLLEVV